MAIQPGEFPVVKSIFAANDPEVMDHEMLVFLKTDTAPDPFTELRTAKSSLPSPSMSPKAAKVGFVPVGKSTFDAKEEVEIYP